MNAFTLLTAISTLLLAQESSACSSASGPHPYTFVYEQYRDFKEYRWAGAGTLAKSTKPKNSLCDTFWNVEIKLDPPLKGEAPSNPVHTNITGYNRAAKEALPIGGKYFLFGYSDGPRRVIPMPTEDSFEKKILLALAASDLKGDKFTEIRQTYAKAIDEPALQLNQCLTNKMIQDAETCIAGIKTKEIGRLFSIIFWNENRLDSVYNYCTRVENFKSNANYKECLVNAAYRIAFSNYDLAKKLCSAQKKDILDACENAANTAFGSAKN